MPIEVTRVIIPKKVLYYVIDSIQVASTSVLQQGLGGRVQQMFS